MTIGILDRWIIRLVPENVPLKHTPIVMI